MKISVLSIAVLAVLALSGRAEASRQYYLAGMRHVYKMNAYPDPYESDREAIEETYAGAVQQAQSQFDQDMQSIAGEEAKDNGAVHQEDRDAVQQNLEEDVSNAADRRDESLGQIYQLDDDARTQHPELAVDEDGPYQVVGVDCEDSNPQVFTQICYYRPYPMYVGACPYGWVYGSFYSYSTFIVVEHKWHNTWIAEGCPVFGVMCFDGGYFQVYAPIRREVIFSHRLWVHNRPPAFTAAQRLVFNHNRALQLQHGVIHGRIYNSPIPGSSYRASHTPGPIKKGPVQSQGGSHTIPPATTHRTVNGNGQNGVGVQRRPPVKSGGSSNNVIPPIRIIGGYKGDLGSGSRYGNGESNSNGGSGSRYGADNGNNGSRLGGNGGSTFNNGNGSRYGNGGGSRYSNGNSYNGNGSGSRYGNGNSNNGSGSRYGNGNSNNGSGSRYGNGNSNNGSGSRYGNGNSNNGSGSRYGNGNSNNGNGSGSRNGNGNGNGGSNNGNGSRSGNGTSGNNGGSHSGSGGNSNSGSNTSSNYHPSGNGSGSQSGSGSSSGSGNNNGNKKNGNG